MIVSIILSDEFLEEVAKNTNDEWTKKRLENLKTTKENLEKQQRKAMEVLTKAQSKADSKVGK